MDTPQKPQMVGDDSHSNSVRCSGSSKRKMLKSDSDSDFDSLPDDVVNEILIRIPAKDILATAMLVCRKWHQITHTDEFISDHLHRSTRGLILSNPNTKEAHFISLKRSGEIEISKFRYKFRNIVWSSCNGLVLEIKFGDHDDIMITNPSTNQHFALPPFIVRSMYPNSRCTMAYIARTMDYKVVRMYYPDRESNPYCAVLTVGVDAAWRLVDTHHLSHEASRLLEVCPLVTDGGFVHWATDWQSNYVMQESRMITETSSQYVLTMNTETEIITRIPAPRSNGGYYYYKYLSGGSFLSLLIGLGYLKWEVWEMKQETGEWTNLPGIDLEAHKGFLNESYDAETALKPGDDECLDCKLVPAGWLKYRDVIVFVTLRPVRGGLFRQARLRVVYSVRTGKISLFSLDNHCHPYIDHKNTVFCGCLIEFLLRSIIMNCSPDLCVS